MRRGRIADRSRRCDTIVLSSAGGWQADDQSTMDRRGRRRGRVRVPRVERADGRDREGGRALLGAGADVRAYDDVAQPQAESLADLIGPLVDVFDSCLTPAEHDALDSN